MHELQNNLNKETGHFELETENCTVASSAIDESLSKKLMEFRRVTFALQLELLNRPPKETATCTLPPLPMITAKIPNPKTTTI